MRPVALLCLLTACDLYFGHPPPHQHGDPDARLPDAKVNTCPFSEGSDPVACNTTGASCSVVNADHVCDCVCTDEGWWSCAADTAGAQCPTALSTCNLVEAETLAGHAGWDVAYGGHLHGGEALSANASDLALPIAFDGAGLVLRVETGPGMGTYAVTIDDAVVATFDANLGSDFAFQVPFAIDAPGAGTHTASIECTTLPCEVDYFEVTCGM
jgi:hypothetical protein